MEDNQITDDLFAEPIVEKKKHPQKTKNKVTLTPPGPESKKTLKVKYDGQQHMYRIYFEEGGTVPKELSGMYTERSRANLAIDAYHAK